MIVVLDASAAVRAALNPGGEYSAIVVEADLVIAPELIIPEVCNAFRKYVRARILSFLQAETASHAAVSMVDEMRTMRDLVPDVLALSAQCESSIYDIFYLSLAMRSRAMLVTDDRALRKAARILNIETIPDAI